MKKKKPKASGYPFRGLFAGNSNEHELVDKLKKIAKEQHRSVSAQARVFLMEAVVAYESKKQ